MAIALLAQVLPLNEGFLLITVVVLAFDLVVGAMSYGCIIGAGYEDYRAVHGHGTDSSRLRGDRAGPSPLFH
ncbi:MAG: hypothetical protein WD830_06335 [Chloroflexota bacterium]